MITGTTVSKNIGFKKNLGPDYTDFLACLQAFNLRAKLAYKIQIRLEFCVNFRYVAFERILFANRLFAPRQVFDQSLGDFFAHACDLCNFRAVGPAQFFE